MVQQIDGATDARPLPQVRLSCIKDLEAEFVLCSPAGMLLMGFNRDPFVEYARVRRLEDSGILSLDCNRLLLPFLGRRAASWQLDAQTLDLRRRLYAVPISRWPDCRDFISSLVWHSLRLRYYAKGAYQVVRVPDPEQPLSLPHAWLTVTVFVAKSSQGNIQLEMISPGVLELVKSAADPDVLQEAAALFGQDGAPSALRIMDEDAT